MKLPGPRSPEVLTVLLDAYADRLPAPHGPRWEREHESGFTASDWDPCRTCGGSGRIVWKKRLVECQRCKGQGGRFVDPYDVARREIEPDSRAEWTLQDLARRLCDLELEELERLVPEALNGERDGMISPPLVYIELEQTLVVVRRAAPAGWSALMLRHVVRLPAAVDEDTYSSALRVLGDMLPRGFDPHVPRWALQAAIVPVRKPNGRGRHALNAVQRKRRDMEIARLAGAGWKAAAIGRRVGVDRRTVERILAA